MIKKLLLISFISFAGSFLHAQTVQCQSASGAWGPCPFVQPVVIATVGGTAQVNNAALAVATTALTHAFPGNTTKGNSIVCVGFSGIAATLSFGDAQTNTYIVATSAVASAPTVTVAVATNIVGGTTDTVTLTTSSGAASFTCHELVGTVTAGQIWDYAPAPLHATSATLVFPQQSASIANDYVIVAVGMGAGTVNATPSIAGAPAVLTTVDQANTAPLSGGADPALSVFYAAHANISNSPTFSQALSLSASETYTAVMVAIKPPSISLVGNVQDPCQQATGSPGSINLTASGRIIVGLAGKQTYLCSMELFTATAQNIALVEGTGSTCATNTAGMAGGATAATGYPLAANGGSVKGGAGFWTNATVTAGDDVCLLLSGSGQTSGAFRYVQQ